MRNTDVNLTGHYMKGITVEVLNPVGEIKNYFLPCKNGHINIEDCETFALDIINRDGYLFAVDRWDVNTGVSVSAGREYISSNDSRFFELSKYPLRIFTAQ